MIIESTFLLIARVKQDLHKKWTQLNWLLFLTQSSYLKSAKFIRILVKFSLIYLLYGRSLHVKFWLCILNLNEVVFLCLKIHKQTPFFNYHFFVFYITSPSILNIQAATIHQIGGNVIWILQNLAVFGYLLQSLSYRLGSQSTFLLPSPQQVCLFTFNLIVPLSFV